MKQSVWYNRYLKTRYWNELRKEVLDRDRWCCVKCKSNVVLQVDHKIYRGEGLEILDDLQTLCYKCHSKKSKRHDLLAWKKLGQKKVSVGGKQLFTLLRRDSGGAKIVPGTVGEDKRITKKASVGSKINVDS